MKTIGDTYPTERLPYPEYLERTYDLRVSGEEIKDLCNFLSGYTHPPIVELYRQLLTLLIDAGDNLNASGFNPLRMASE